MAKRREYTPSSVKAIVNPIEGSWNGYLCNEENSHSENEGKLHLVAGETAFISKDASSDFVFGQVADGKHKLEDVVLHVQK
jgi:hypothetical protein